jgi:hypothetical protein
MIQTLALVIVALGLTALIAWLDWNNRKERSKLINAIMAKTPEQLRDLEFVDKVQPAKMTTPNPDIVPIEQVSDEDFAEMVGQHHG